MNARDTAELGRYVRWIADEMGLRDWLVEFRVTDDLPKPTGITEPDDVDVQTQAICDPTPGQKRAWLYFRPNVRDESRERVRHIVTHELLHCHMADMREFPRTLAFRLLNPEAYRSFSFGFDLAWEHAVDAIAMDWARKMPLIQWPKATNRRSNRKRKAKR